MDSKKVNLGSVLAGALWVVSGLLMFGGIVVGYTAGHLPTMMALGGSSLLVVAGAAVATVRHFVCQHERFMHDAFTYGREVGGDNLRRIRH